MTSLSEQITSTIPEFFFIWSIPEKKIIYISDSIEILMEKSGRIKDFDRIKKIIIPKEHKKFEQLFEKINQGHFHQDIDFISADKQHPKYINIKTFPVRDNGKINKVAGQVIDITRKIEKEQLLERKNQKIEDILHILAHDLRGPLGNIVNMAQLQEESDDLDMLKSFARIIGRISNESIRLINSMIELVELESDSFELDSIECNIKNFIESTISPYKKDAADKNITIQASFPDQPIHCMLDPVKFRLVIQNLLSNAIKFTDNGGKINVIVNPNNTKIKIMVEDDGIGIPEKQLENLFEKFSTARRKGLRGEKSTGLGLSITKKIVELHGGNIEVNSIEGDGSEFIIDLPVNKPKEQDKTMAEAG